MLGHALELIEEGNKRGIPLRLLGALAIYVHCPSNRHLYEKVWRAPTDIDMITYSKFRGKVVKLMEQFGYRPVQRFVALYGMFRHIYYSDERDVRVDLFFDKLEMCHTINFKNRLELDSPTIPVEDLLLEKLQIVKISEKDLKDIIILLKEHDVGPADDREIIDIRYIAKLLAKDWGFYYTVTLNLDRIKKYMRANPGPLAEEDIQEVEAKIDRLREAIEKEPKSLKWKLRARTGPKKKWYRDVTEEFAAIVMEGGEWKVKKEG